VATVWGFFGVAVVALPSGIIGSGLVDVMNEAKEQKQRLQKLRKQEAVPALLPCDGRIRSCQNYSCLH
jgi:hypothetical protein